MKKNEIHIGGTYMAKVSDKIVPVRLDAEHSGGGGWDATNLVSNKKVRIKSAQRLRGEAKRGHAAALGSDEAKDAAPTPEVTTTPEVTPATPAEAASDKPAGKTKAPKKAREPKPKKDRPMSGLDAAAKILEDAAPEALRCKAIVEAIFAKGLWTSDGKTPEATLYSAMMREIAKLGPQARFKKTDRGLFAHNGR